jgi:hypothetical protein
MSSLMKIFKNPKKIFSEKILVNMLEQIVLVEQKENLLEQKNICLLEKNQKNFFSRAKFLHARIKYF